MRNEAAACGYEFIIRSRETDAVMGIQGLQKGHYFASDGILPFGSTDLRIVLLLTRTCDAIRNNYKQDECNDSISSIRERASTPQLKAQLDHILGEPDPSSIDAETRKCVDFSSPTPQGFPIRNHSIRSSSNIARNWRTKSAKPKSDGARVQLRLRQGEEEDHARPTSIITIAFGTRDANAGLEGDKARRLRPQPIPEV